MELPKNAKKVFSGKIFDVYQWEQEMFDGSFTTFEMLKRPNTLNVIALEGDQILLSREEQPTKKKAFTLIGGRQDTGETPFEGVKRELLEESGYSSEQWESWRVFRPYGKIDWEVHIFIAKNCTKVAEQNLDPGERIEISKVSFDEFVELASQPNFWGRELQAQMLRMKLEPEKLEEFRKRLFS